MDAWQKDRHERRLKAGTLPWREYVATWQAWDVVQEVTLEDCTMVVTKVPAIWRAPFNGYVVVSRKKVPAGWTLDDLDSFAQGLEVHGGCTLHEMCADAVMFGFDTAHLEDANDPDLFKFSKVWEMTAEFLMEVRLELGKL